MGGTKDFRVIILNNRKESGSTMGAGRGTDWTLRVTTTRPPPFAAFILSAAFEPNQNDVMI